MFLTKEKRNFRTNIICLLGLNDIIAWERFKRNKNLGKIKKKKLLKTKYLIDLLYRQTAGF